MSPIVSQGPAPAGSLTAPTTQWRGGGVLGPTPILSSIPILCLFRLRNYRSKALHSQFPERRVVWSTLSNFVCYPLFTACARNRIYPISLCFLCSNKISHLCFFHILKLWPCENGILTQLLKQYTSLHPSLLKFTIYLSNLMQVT